jgi:hypothetical protein
MDYEYIAKLGRELQGDIDSIIKVHVSRLSNDDDVNAEDMVKILLGALAFNYAKVCLCSGIEHADGVEIISMILDNSKLETPQ